MKPTLTEASELIEDFDIYPRADISSGHIAQMVESLHAGVELPPIIAEIKTKRLVDGFHRRRAWMRFADDDNAKVPCIFKTYKDDAELFLDAMRLNANHGRNLTGYDKTRAIEKAVRFEIDPKLIAGALNLTVERVTGFKVQRCAKIESSRNLAALKMPIRHLAGKTISQSQADAIPKLGGNQQGFYVSQLLILIREGMIDTENEKLMGLLAELKKELVTLLEKKHAVTA